MYTSFRGPYDVIFQREKKYISYFNKGEILDIGCGRGEFLQLLKENNLGYFGIDTDDNLIKILKENDYNVKKTDFINFNPDRRFNGIMAAHIIEHIPGKEIYSFLKKINNLLKINGIAVIITPNFQNLEVATETFWRDIEHQRPYPLSIMENLLIENGFEIIDKGFDEDTGFKGVKRILRHIRIIGKYFTPKDIFIVGKKIKEIY